MIGLDGVSAQTLSDTIGSIYDCALDPLKWPDTCRSIADLCESTAGGICVHDLRHVQNDQLFVFGYQPTFLEKLGTHYAQSPMAVADIVANIGDVSALSMQHHELLESRFFRDVLKPFGLWDMIWFPALRTGGRMASMHASRGETAPHYQQREISMLKLLRRMSAAHWPSPMRSISGRCDRSCSKRRLMRLSPAFSSRHGMAASST